MQFLTVNVMRQRT